ncbi:beta-galactosidase [Galactobacter sp.]|uniref:beta-galactosidase n=1 Tax=Galactobacter sp. TaxID=2676125 RepID=UPI0025B8FDC6|nr:beta-galactosidase [Galactobacter sp.]
MTSPRPHRWLRRDENLRRAIGYGADYNPDQWPEEVWAEDIELMQQAGVNIVTPAVFSWARIQPGPDQWDFEWLDKVMDMLHAGGISVDLATATASPPPWLTTLHPEILPVNERGETLWPGARQQWRATSAVFREYALALVEKMARRYKDHPALASWHVSNELGCHNALDYSDEAAAGFREWLQERYGTVSELNRAWGTSFWSQRYTEWEQVLPPRIAPSYPNPTQQLDFRRFSSDALKDYLKAEVAVLDTVSPDVPVTTNFMVMGETDGVDYASWAPEIDFVANDHYRQACERPDDELSFSASLTSGIAGHRPWYLMEHATSAVNWQDINLTKSTAVMIHDALSHVSHGADSVAFFQWRASAAGAEKYHSGMVPHAGADSTLFRGVCELGAVLQALSPVTGSLKKRAQVALVFDYHSWWASELDSHPSASFRYRQEALDWYSALLEAGIAADVVPAGTPLSGYRAVITPGLYIVDEAIKAQLSEYVSDGGHLISTNFSGIADQNDHIYLGRYPGALRELLGIRVEEFSPLPEGASVALSNGSSGTLWSEPVTITDSGVETLVSYASGPFSGGPAITRRTAAVVTGSRPGSATYVSTRLGIDGVNAVLPVLLTEAGVEREMPLGVAGQVERVLRTDGVHNFVFLLNRTDRRVDVPDQPGTVLYGVRGDEPASLVLEGHGVAVLQRAAL